MARKLDDVLHYFVPELAERELEPAAAAEASPPARTQAARAVMVAVPLGERDVVRAALVWNLAVELARRGVPAAVLAPADGESSPLWPDPGSGPLGCELALTFADGIGDLARAAFELAEERAREAGGARGVVFVRLPPAWLAKIADGVALCERLLLFSSPERPELLETYALAKLVLSACPTAQIGVAIHGARSVADARDAFLRLARASERHLLRSLVSYGLVADDVALYRSIVSRRPVGLSHPTSAGARSLGDIARLLAGDLAASA